MTVDFSKYAPPPFPWRALATLAGMAYDIDEEGCGAVFGALVSEADSFTIGPPCLQREYERRYNVAWGET